jgi:hypothetical protein
MTFLNQAIELITQGGLQPVTKVPRKLYESVLQEFPPAARVSKNVEETNLIVYQGLYAISPINKPENEVIIPPALKLVPRSPTLKMLEAGEACYNRKDPRDSAKCIAVHVFRSMYDAAPTCPETKEQP